MKLTRFGCASAVIALAAVTACWRSSPPPPARPEEPPPPMPAVMHTASPKTEIEQVFEDLNGFADDLCNCGDPTCVQRVTEEITRWQDRAADNEAPKMTDEDSKRMAEIGERMGRCMQNAMNGPAAGSATP